MNATKARVLPQAWRAASALLAGAGALGVGAGLVWAPARTWPNLLLGDVYLLSLALGGAVFLSMQYLSGAGWSAVLRRLAEAMMAGLPVAAVLLISVVFGHRTLYPWARTFNEAGTSTLASSAYLTAPLIFGRMTAMLALWTVLARDLRRTSLRQDRDPAPAHHRRLVRISAAFLVVFAVTFTLGSVDWLMSLSPRWSSTIFAIYVFAGLLVSGLAALTLAAIVLSASGPLFGVVRAAHLHDLGKLLFAFSTFWAYIWFSQYLLIWYSNLPDEATYYVRRTSGPWAHLFVLNLVLNWVAPCVVLLPRAAKRSARVLAAVCVVVLAGHWLDLYLLIMPETRSGPQAGAIESAVPLACAGIFIMVMARALEQAPLVPVNDPYIDESLNHET